MSKKTEYKNTKNYIKWHSLSKSAKPAGLGRAEIPLGVDESSSGG